MKSYEKENKHQQGENEMLLEKVNKLLQINKDLIASKEAESNESNNEPKVVMQGSPESEAEFLKIQLASAAFERDVEKYKIINLKLRQENNLQSDQVDKP